MVGINALCTFSAVLTLSSKAPTWEQNLDKQIAEAVEEVTGCRGVGVIVEAQHMCMMMRGVQKQNSMMRTSVMKGVFRDNQATRNEFMRLVGL